ncbi:DUF4236 domain-containing protein [Acidicapsa dinghuensis]|uniref:DUF4236 domain-containing protein n=1 Tax=Acidicapsa dinghuensis TaxID=2218256 RepID=A0ABW1ECM8_9BACT
MAFRKSLNLGPLRINASKSGLGYSVGGRGFRIGRDAKGRPYKSFSIPGTGIYNRTYAGGKAKSRGNQYAVSSQRNTAFSGGKRVSSRKLATTIGYFVMAGLIYLLLSWVSRLF